MKDLISGIFITLGLALFIIYIISINTMLGLLMALIIGAISIGIVNYLDKR